MSRLSRNDLCWCGSERKYKSCHMEHDMKLSSLKLQGFPVPSRKSIKNAEQIEGIRKSAVITKDILDMLEEKIKEGVTTNQINEWVHEYTVKNGGIPAPLNYNGYPKSVCTSINEVVCHGIPDETVLKEGDIINVDVTTILSGFYSDASRMYTIGKISDEARKLVDCTKECLHIGMEQVKPFVSISEIGCAIEEHANANGFSVVRDYGGHGVGLDIHEEPFIYHYKNSMGMILVPGMVITIEPMLNQGGYKCKLLKDGWTAVTRDGSLSAQWEHTLLVTDSGYEVLV